MTPVRLMVTVQEAACRLGISEYMVSKAISLGRLEGVKHGKTWLVYLDSVNSYKYEG